MKLGRVYGWRTIVALALLAGVRTECAQAPQETQHEAPGAEPTIVEVRIVKEQDGRVLAASPSGIAVESGKPLDPEKVAESLRALYRTGDYADIKAITTAVSGGVRLDFVAKENLFFNRITFAGLVEPPTDASAAAAMQIGLGQIYRKAMVDEALDRLRETLREEGFYRAELSAEESPHPETHEMDIIVHVKPGPRARVAVIHLTNGTEYPDTKLLALMKMKAGTEITAERVQRGTERIRKFLGKKGHLSSRASLRRGEYDAAKNLQRLELEVSEGPLVRVIVNGAKFSQDSLKRLIPIYQEGAVDADLLEEGKRNLLERLEREGYFDASVKYSTDTHESKTGVKGGGGTEETITYAVERGGRHELVGIDITGNKYFSDELLRGRLQIYREAFGSRGRFSRRLIESDGQSMRALYEANGFLQAKVETQVEDDYKGKEGDVYVRFKVQEGRQTRVASLTIEGNQAFKQQTLLGVVGSTPGQPYSESGVTSDRDNILALYFNEGFPEAAFTATSERVTPDAALESKNNSNTAATAENGKKEAKEPKPMMEQADNVRLSYHIQEGPQTRVRRILLSGYQHTRPGVIRREVRVKVGQPLREGDVVESQRRLYNLGVFNRVTIEAQNPTGTDVDKDIALLVEEAKRYTIAYGGGFEVQRLASTTNPTGSEIEAAPRGILELSKLNLTGRGDSLSFKLRGSTIEGRALLGYSVPDTFGSSHFSTQATAYAEKTQDINTFTEERYEGTMQLTEQVTPLTTILYHYSFRQVRVFDLKILPQEVPLFNAPTLVSQFGVTWVRDSRDNPADASKGSFNSVDVSDADTSFGSSASFLRVFFQNSTYYPIKRRFSFARSIRLGILEPYRDTVSLNFPAPTCPTGETTCTLPNVIPLPERFFGGGGTSLRGFALNQAGPRDSLTGFPVGGQAMLVLNQEFRFPMHLPFFGNSLGGAIFYDGGNVYSRLTRFSFRTTLPDPTFALQNPGLPASATNLEECVTHCTNELNYFSHTVGFGFRYKTPVGPIRIDLGYQINRPEFVIPVPCPSSEPTCVAGSLGQEGARLPGFQIFFNLGASF